MSANTLNNQLALRTWSTAHPVEEKTCPNTGPREARVRLGLLDQVVDRRRLGLEPVAEDLALQVASVEAVLGRDETLDAGGGGGVDERVLRAGDDDGDGRDGGDDGVLADEGGGERLDGRQVGPTDGDARRERGGRGLAGNGRDVEALFLQGLDDAEADEAGSLYAVVSTSDLFTA